MRPNQLPSHASPGEWRLGRCRAALVASLLLASMACACNIPVFRYALERWRPDPCEIIVFYEDEMSDSQRELVDSLKPDSRNSGANVKVVESDLRNADATSRALWDSIPSSERKSTPYVLVRTKVGPGKIIQGWHGPLGELADNRLLDSPVRKELGQRLLAGHSVVWIMVGSKDRDKTDAARRLLMDNLEPLANRIELPEGIGLPGSELHSEIPLLLKFSMLEIQPGDPREDFLIKLFSGFQTEAFEKGEPLLIPVFGRGRALEVIPASDLTPRLMEDLTGFLSGACSCQVKEQNPGFDLLLSVDWNTELFGEGQPPPPERTKRDRKRQPILLTIPPGNKR